MALDPVFRGRVREDGLVGFAEEERDVRRAHLQSLAGKDIDVIYREHKDTRSLRANNYYWSVVLTRMSMDGSQGDQSPEEIHDAMCEMFLPNEKKRVDFFNAMTGERLTMETERRRTSKLTGAPFYDFVEKVRKFALEFMGIVTEDPDPSYWRQRNTKAMAA